MRFLLVLFAAAAAAPLVAQDLQRPSDWTVRFDRPDRADSIYFVEMPPGWHITTGHAAILYNPATTASGSFTAEAVISLFPGPAREAFGLFIGGMELDNDAQDYLYFMVRGDGRFIVKHRYRDETHTIQPWTVDEAVTVHPGDAPLRYTLTIRIDGRNAHFSVNGTEVHTLELPGFANTDGVVGLRVNHNLNLHVLSLEVR